MSEKNDMQKENAEKIIIAVVGGGASGLSAAISAADFAVKNNIKITVNLYEANQRVGKKLLVTGNGRCNLSNKNLSPDNYFGSRELAASVFSRFGRDDALDFFRRAGLYTKTDFAGRIYPLSNQASSVLDCLRNEAQRLNINIISETYIDTLLPHKDGYLLNGRYYADRCIIACGGKACAEHTDSRGGYQLLYPFGVKLTEMFPALTAIKIENFTKALKGIRAEGAISVRSGGKILAEDTGEIQYTDYGLSGIPSMQVSRAASDYFAHKSAGDIFAYVDRAPSLTYDEIYSLFTERKKLCPSQSCEMLLAGIMPKRLGVTVLSDLSINPEKSIDCLHDAVICKIASAIKQKKYKISSVCGFADAQVTAGGIAAEEIDFNTLELKKARGIYVCGEIADVDGQCGGYNLQWAWSSGAVAGISAAGEKNNAEN